MWHFPPQGLFIIHFQFMIDSGRGAARAQDAQGTLTQSHKSRSILVQEDDKMPLWKRGGRGMLGRGGPCPTWLRAGLGFEVWELGLGLGFGVWSLGWGVPGSGFRVQASGFRVQGSGCRVQGSGIRVQSLWFGRRSGYWLCLKRERCSVPKRTRHT